jgi:hypothetical protein
MSLLTDVPRPIASLAENLLGQIASGKFAPEANALVSSLLFDTRMHAVWDLVLRRKRSGTFRYPARSDGLNPFSYPLEVIRRRAKILSALEGREAATELKRLSRQIGEYQREEGKARQRIQTLSALERQELACWTIFRTAFSGGLEAKSILDSRDLETSEALVKFAGLEPSTKGPKTTRYDIAAEVLHAADFSQAANVFTSTDIAMAANYLESIASEFERLARLSQLLLKRPRVDIREVVTSLRQKAKRVLSWSNSSRLYVRRHRGDSRLRAFAIELDETMLRLFGSSMHGTAAKIANVVFEREDITLSKMYVRGLLPSVTFLETKS